MRQLDSLTAKLAALLLLQEGELAMSDIEALPSVDDPEIARDIAQCLIDTFDAEWEQRRIGPAETGFWEAIIRLKEQPTKAKVTSSNRSAGELTKEHFEDILRKASAPSSS